MNIQKDEQYPGSLIHNHRDLEYFLGKDNLLIRRDSMTNQGKSQKKTIGSSFITKGMGAV
jgi:hypothetical protein